MPSHIDSSNPHAKSVLILGHTVSGMGEKSIAMKYQRGLLAAGYRVHPVVDIIQLLGEDYEPLAKLNYDLADNNSAILEDIKPTPTLEPCDLLMILSWSFSVAALMATGVHKRAPTAVNLYAHHPNERIIHRLYEPADLLLTISLLGNERARKYGLDPGKILYLPHTYLSEYEGRPSNRAYAERLAAEQGKTLRPSTRIIGCVGRFEYGKNCEYAIEAVRLLVSEGHDVALILKGDFPTQTPQPDFKPIFTQMLETYRHEPWLLWDSRSTPYPQVLEEYAAFDLLLHPSGAEGASHVVVEALGLHKPVVVLNCTTNPYLFKGLATFVKTDPQIKSAQLPFYVPDLNALCKALVAKLTPPDPSKVSMRFHESVLQERIPLLFERDPRVIADLHKQDRRRYDL